MNRDEANRDLRLLVDARVERMCDRCGREVPPDNDALLFEVLLGQASVFTLFAQSRHLLPVGDCPGSPSRAQYIEGQPPDPRPEYSLNTAALELARRAYARMQDVAAT